MLFYQRYHPEVGRIAGQNVLVKIYSESAQYT